MQVSAQCCSSQTEEGREAGGRTCETHSHLLSIAIAFSVLTQNGCQHFLNHATYLIKSLLGALHSLRKRVAASPVAPVGLLKWSEGSMHSGEILYPNDVNKMRIDSEELYLVRSIAVASRGD